MDADLIIAGAGCAGLSALWQVIQRPATGRRIVVVDRHLEPTDDRTWSFWGAPSDPFAHLADRAWQRVQVRFPRTTSIDVLGRGHARGSSHRRAYRRVRSRDYTAAILDAARRDPDVCFVESDIRAIRDDQHHGTVTTDDGELRAPVVFQSVELCPSDVHSTVRHRLRQHFGGWEVQTEHPVFDPDVVTLMDFDTAQHDGTAFYYVLPDAPDRALVEHTMFSLTPRPPSFHDERIRSQLDAWGAGAFTIERTEYGCIPMEDRVLHQRWGRHVWNLGTVGGMSKPTTGYTFQRIHAQAEHLVASWFDTGCPTPLPATPARYRFADRTLLHLLHHRPELGRTIFERLFDSTSIDDVLTFLDEDSSMLADARMVASLPLGPFLTAAITEIGAGFTRPRLGRRGQRDPGRSSALEPVHAGFVT